MIGLKSWTIEDRLTHSYWILKRHLIHPLMNLKHVKSKLFSDGIGSKALKWIDSFLCFRQQRGVVNWVKSDWAPVLSGVPQDTVLGPLLFSLYINDISSDVESEIRLFLMTVCYREIKDEVDTVKLQSDIDRFGSWARNWGMRFQPVKCNMCNWQENRSTRSMLHTPWRELTLKTLKALNTLEKQLQVIWDGIHM